MTTATRVYKFGCRKPDNEKLALQLLGQAFNYAEDLRRVYNTHKRNVKFLLKSGDDASHVIAFEYEELKRAQKCVRKGRHMLDAGTYWLVEAAALAASKSTKLDTIKQARWDGTGRLGAAIQSASKFPASAWSHPRVQLTLPDDRGHAQLTIVTGDMKDPRSITWPIKLHRPFPEGAIVQQVAVQRIRTGWRYRWEALITIAYEEQQRDELANGTVGVDLGWRWVEGDLLLVATTSRPWDDRGDKQLILDVLPDLFYADEVKGTRDRLFDDVKRYAKEQRLPGHEHVHLWKDKARMHALAQTTRDFGLLWWAYRDRHIEDIEANVRGRALNRRKDTFRVFADALAKRYKTVALEDGLYSSDFDEHGKGDEREKTHAQERRRKAAATRMLQDTIAHRCTVDWVVARGTTATCSECGEENWEIGAAEAWTCPSCGAEHQRDENAAKNIERLSVEGKGRFARTAKPKKKKEKKQRAITAPLAVGGIAREPLSNAAG